MRAAAAVVVLALLAAGCGGAPKKTAPQQSRAPAFSTCMRTNGVPNYPDPDPSGQLVKESLGQLGVSSSQFQSAETACKHLLPNGGNGPSPVQQEHVKELALHFSQCVRAHGVPRFPDPDGTGRIPPDWPGVDQGSPVFEAANQACAQYRPPYVPSNAAYNAWARTQPNGS